MRNNGPDNEAPIRNSAEVREQLERIVRSPGFSASPKLARLLSYLVEQVLLEDGGPIRAKTVSIDLYGSDAKNIEKKANVVRVDAGRVRKKLADYYARHAGGDEIVISLPTGSYAPVIGYPELPQAAAQEAERSSHNGGSSRFILAAGIVLCVVGLGALFWNVLPGLEGRSVAPNAIYSEQRSSIFEDSPARLRAINLAEQGRDLIFPAVDQERLALALQAFQAAGNEDPDYFGSYAGAAQIHTTRYLLTGEPNVREAELRAAHDAIDRAKSLAPGAPWSLSAQAWLEYAESHCASALRLSDRAVRSDPIDPHLAEFDALTSLFCGRFDRVEERVEAILPHLDGDRGYVFMNALGSAHFHRGDYAQTIVAFEASIASGGPTGPISLAYLMAAHQRAGATERARELADLYQENFPGQRVDLLMQRLYVDSAYGNDLADAMTEAGFLTN